MNRWSVPAALLIVCAGQASAQGEVPFWVPTHPGDTWIYQHESRAGATGGIANPKAQRWKTEETAVKQIAVLEGTIVVRRIRTFDGKPPAPQPKQEAWLIHGDCLYDLDPGDWDPSHPKELSDAFHKQPPWMGGEHVRVFCFPLSEDKTWGKESGHEWRVAKVTDSDPASLDKGKTYQVSSYTGSGLTEDIWFERGVGIIKEDDVHSGTQEESHSQLLFYGPGLPRELGTVPTPAGEIGVQYSYNSFTTTNSSEATNTESNESGGTLYGQYLFKKAGGGLGIAGEFGGSSSNSGSLYTFLAGPRINLGRRRQRLIWFVELLAGGAYVRVNGASLAASNGSLARGTFAIGAADGLDFRVSDRYDVTLFRVEFLSLEVPDAVSGASHWQSGLRVSTGIAFRFREK